MKLLKKLVMIASFSTFLTACVNTQQMNQKAESEFSQLKGELRQAQLLDTNSNTAQRIHNVFNRMRPYADRENKTGVPFRWELIVVKENELNAWAMPGGKMAFYTGLVDRLNLNDDEIATVMGHEMIHALNEHSKSDANRNVATNILFNVTQAVVGDVNVGGYSALGLLKTYGVDNPFSRSAESEADEQGLYLMAKAGYNPKATPNLWVKMAKASGGAGGFFSTHPADEDRQANMQKWMPKALEYYNAR